MDRQTIIQGAIDTLGAGTYLEIGVSYGDVFLQTTCRRKIAVDPHFRVPLRRKLRHLPRNFGSVYFQEASDEFFRKHASLFDQERSIDVALVDGLHTYEQSLRDVQNCLAHLSPRGVVVMHDCNPATEELEHIDASGDVWKAVVHLRSTRKDLQVAVLDCDYGVGVVSRGPGKTLDVDVSALSGMTYADLSAHRQEWLNLQPPAYLTEFLKLAAGSSPVRQ